ncbi:SpoIIE family protein phosphatase [Streptacidiphilus sp. PAMC 29251]
MSVLLLDSEDVAWFRDGLTGAPAAASRLAGRVGLSEHRAGEVALAVSEAASNLYKHAVAGSIVLRIVRNEERAGIEFLAMDTGPGMADVAASMRDGRSTAGTLGIGLGMIARLADTFDLHSIPGQGTVMLARFWPRDAGRPTASSGGPAQSVVEGVTRPISGGQECGDSWAARWDDAARSAPRLHLPNTGVDPQAGVPDPAAPRSDRPPGKPASAASDSRRAILVMLCDGLGHGPLAQLAAQAAIRAFRSSRCRSPDEALQEIHQALSGTRGAAVAVARIEPDQKRVLFCAVGNIAAAVVTPASKTSLPSVSGTAGHQAATVRASSHSLPPGSALVMHSDGLTERWRPQELPGLLQHSPAVIAGQLLRTAGKYHDDASIVVAKGMW